MQTDPTEAASLLWHGLNDCANLDRTTAIAAVSSWLDFHGAGCPDVPLLREKVRQDAIFWADLASPDELAAYFLASGATLRNTPLGQKQTKIILAEMFTRLSVDDRNAFMKWAEKQ